MKDQNTLIFYASITIACFLFFIFAPIESSFIQFILVLLTFYFAYWTYYMYAHIERKQRRIQHKKYPSEYI